MPFARHTFGERGASAVFSTRRTQPNIRGRNAERDQAIPHLLGVFVRTVHRDEIVPIHTVAPFEG
jgi:hypothetical protein